MHSLLSSTTLLVSVLATSVLAAPQSGDSSSATTTASSSEPSVSGVHSVQVGPGLTFTPDSLTAAEGEWVEFTFGSGHSVAQSSFDAPCVPLASGAGVYSGFPNDGDVWRFQVNSTSPIWLYCSKVGHCEGGMALVVNPPDNANTLDAYKAAAANANTSSPPVVQGGVFGAASDSSNDTSSGSSSSTSGSETSSSTASATGSAATSSSTGNAASNVARNSLFAAGALAGAVAALL